MKKDFKPIHALNYNNMYNTVEHRDQIHSITVKIQLGSTVC